jgi:hyaluronoglucosaminidase
VRGIIEGFYGPPWTWVDRRRVSETLAGAGMDTYVYAPKDDPLHRERWREPYDDASSTNFQIWVLPAACASASPCLPA